MKSIAPFVEYSPRTMKNFRSIRNWEIALLLALSVFVVAMYRIQTGIRHLRLLLLVSMIVLSVAEVAVQAGISPLPQST